MEARDRENKGIFYTGRAREEGGRREKGEKRGRERKHGLLSFRAIENAALNLI